MVVVAVHGAAIVREGRSGRVGILASAKSIPDRAGVFESPRLPRDNDSTWSFRGSSRDEQAGSRAARPARRRGATYQRAARAGVSGAGTEDLSVDLRPLCTRIHARERAPAHRPSPRSQPRPQPARRQQLGAALLVLPRSRAFATPGFRRPYGRGRGRIPGHAPAVRGPQIAARGT
ncbi:conserved hypothetical protein [Aromatoleum aromaticum EbN1]|uniref:Uncharacterized protein n=1 Tax=Aromatoleum aromaticum (strain DSM 19018 / LMG 30748 / EbN1) TaxID=76114 RepID=Q5P8W2_AROAE|nr:conserved hypothetical protein [Aromatoleum aromaticum EbN1]